MANTKKPLRVQKPEPEPERGQNGGWLAAGGRRRRRHIKH